MNTPAIDAYTKAILTIIAICLLVLTFKQLDIATPAFAEEAPAPSPAYGLVPLNEDGSITVRLEPSSDMNVNLSQIGGRHVSYGGPIPVKTD